MPNTLKRVSIDELVPNEHNARSDVGDIEDLAESIVNTGLLEPLVAYKDGDQYRLIAGHRRLAAIKLASANGLLGDDYKVDVIVRPKIDDSEQLAMMLVENMQRVDLPLVDQVHGIFALVSEHGWTQAKVAEQLGQSIKMVKQRAKWANLPDAIINRVESGHLRISDLDDLAGLPEDVRAKLLKKPALSQWDIQSAVQDKNRARALASFCRKLGKLGHVVVYDGNRDAMSAAAQAFIENLNTKTKTTRDIWHEPSFFEQITGIVTPALIFVASQHSTFKLEIYTEPADAAAWDKPSHNRVDDPIPDEELTDYDREHRRLNEAHVKAVEEHRDKVTAAQVAYLTESKPSELIQAVLMNGVERSIGYGLSATDTKLLEAVCPEVDVKDKKAVLAYAAKNSTNLARVAATLKASAYQGLVIPAVEELGKAPSWEDYRIDPDRFDEDGNRLSDEEYEAAKAVEESVA